jgi:hypothetical protein
MEVRYLDSARDEAFAAADFYEGQARASTRTPTLSV